MILLFVLIICAASVFGGLLVGFYDLLVFTADWFAL